MTPAEFEWHQEVLEFSYGKGVITAGDFRDGMRDLGFSDKAIDGLIAELDGDVAGQREGRSEQCCRRPTN